VVPLLEEKGAGKIAFRVTMGVRHGETAWKHELNEIIRKRRADIDKVLLSYGVPLLVSDDTSMEMVTKPRHSEDESSSDDATKASAQQPGKPATAH
jgi:hypothetical protein